MNVVVVGAGYVGLVSAAGFAEFGNNVVCVDTDLPKVTKLLAGALPIYEPGLDRLVRGGMASGRLHFTFDLAHAVSRADVVFIAVGTPPLPDGSTDLAQVLQAARGVGEAMRSAGVSKVVVIKSTVPVGTSRTVSNILSSFVDGKPHVASNPEFLREGSAVEDFLRPDRVVIGTDDDLARDTLLRLYRPVSAVAEILTMCPVSSELVKYASNALLATRISFMNELSELSAAVGADMSAVRQGVGSDRRIGSSYLYPGPGFGGSCFPKDLSSLLFTASSKGVRLRVAQATVEANAERKHKLAAMVKDHFGSLRRRKVAVWGLAFKAETDDIRESPAVTLVEDLLAAGANVVAHDPQAIPNAQRHFVDVPPGRLKYASDMYEAVDGADALVLCTEWRQYRALDVQELVRRSPDVAVFDGRNIWEASDFRSAGVPYSDICSSVLGKENDLHPVRVLDASSGVVSSRRSPALQDDAMHKSRA